MQLSHKQANDKVHVISSLLIKRYNRNVGINGSNINKLENDGKSRAGLEQIDTVLTRISAYYTERTLPKERGSMQRSGNHRLKNLSPRRLMS